MKLPLRRTLVPPVILFSISVILSLSKDGTIFLLVNSKVFNVMPSSVVAAIRYDEKTSKLRVIFQSGSIYDYLKVPANVYDEMKKAFSKGEFLNKEIKPNYEFEKVR